MSNPFTPQPDPHPDHRFRSRSGWIPSLVIGLVLLSSACSKSAEASSADRDEIVDQLVEEMGLSKPTAACIIDTALQDFDLEQLATLNEVEPDPEVADAVRAIVEVCLREKADGAGAESDDPGAVDFSSTDNGGESEPESSDDNKGADTTDGDDAVDPSLAALEVTTPGFCDASQRAFESIIVLDYLSYDASGLAFEAAFGDVMRDLDAATTEAPSAALGAASAERLALFQGVDAVVAGYGYDWASVSIDELDDDLSAFWATVSTLHDYLVDHCGLDPDLVEGDAEDRATELEITYIDSPPEPKAATAVVDDEPSGISGAVPPTWVETRSANGADTRSLTLAVSVEDYQRSWLADGVMVTAIDVNGDIDGTNETVTDTAAWNDCDLVSSEEYFDGVYVGNLYHFQNCGDTLTQAAVIAAASSDWEVFVLVELQMQSFDYSVLDAIAMSFIA